MDLDQIKLKYAGQLNDDEKDYLRQNIDKLNDEDKEAYSSFLTPPEPEGGEPEVTPETPVEPEAPAPVTPEPEAPVEPEKPTTAFQTEEQAKEFVRLQLEENEKKKQAAIDAAKTPVEKKYVEDTWKPNNWNESIKTIKDVVKQELKEERETEESEKNAKVYESQWKDLAKDKGLPNLDTNEGKVVHKEIVSLMLGFEKKTFAEGYDLWLKAKGKAPAPEAPATPEPTPSEAASILAKSKASSARAGAAKIGGQNAGNVVPSGKAPLKPLTYEELHTKSATKILKEALG